MEITVENLVMELKGAIDDLFVAKVAKGDDEDFLGKTSYSYSDVLCGNVKIKRM